MRGVCGPDDELSRRRRRLPEPATALNSPTVFHQDKCKEASEDAVEDMAQYTAGENVSLLWRKRRQIVIFARNTRTVAYQANGLGAPAPISGRLSRRAIHLRLRFAQPTRLHNALPDGIDPEMRLLMCSRQDWRQARWRRLEDVLLDVLHSSREFPRP